MRTNEKLAVWIDHSIARLIPYSADVKTVTTIVCENARGNHARFNKNEADTVNRIRQQQSAFYEEIASTIQGYSEILLFGPANAKLELFNVISDNPSIEEIRISIKSVAQMSENEMHIYVKDHFRPIAFMAA
jgi:hypothetical protein